jgi:putative transposase
MGQSLSKLYVHLVFHTKNSLVPVRMEDRKHLYAYIGTIIKENESIPILINGMEDHIHVLCVMSKNISLAKLTEEIKRNSSRWIKTQHSYYRQFSWQGGYAGFSVSQSLLEKTKNYILYQEEHHNRMTFKEESIAFLKEYCIDYDDRYQ